MAKMKMGETICKKGLKLKRMQKGVRIIGSFGPKSRPKKSKKKRKR